MCSRMLSSAIHRSSSNPHPTRVRLTGLWFVSMVDSLPARFTRLETLQIFHCPSCVVFVAGPDMQPLVSQVLSCCSEAT
jgi:hypothetical protein